MTIAITVMIQSRLFQLYKQNTSEPMLLIGVPSTNVKSVVHTGGVCAGSAEAEADNRRHQAAVWRRQEVHPEGNLCAL